jgi:hypothetical protein
MRSKQAHLVRFGSIRRWTAIVCLLLAGIACAAQAFHSHPDDLAGDARHCAACQVAHAPARIAPVAHLFVHRTITAFVGTFARPDLQQGPDSFPLFCRPPPSLLTGPLRFNE